MTVQQLMLLLMVEDGNFEFNQKHQDELYLLQKARYIQRNYEDTGWYVLPSVKKKIKAILELLS